MELRSRKVTPKPPTDGGADIKYFSDTDSDEESYEPSSDSDYNCSDTEGGMPAAADAELLLGLSKGKAKANLGIPDGKRDVPSSSNPPAALTIKVEPADEPVVGVYLYPTPAASPTVATTQTDSPGSRKRKQKSGGKNDKDSWRPPLLWEIWEEQQENWLDNYRSEDLNLDELNHFVAGGLQAPSELVMPLLRYQKEWLAWAWSQEFSLKRGGILADEMGMGKTIQAISLVLSQRETHRKLCEAGVPESCFTGGSSFGVKATIVVCPVVAVTQWVSEIERFTKKGSAKVLVYHGANRGKDSKQFAEYDFVITTYSTVEAEFRKFMMPSKEKCRYCFEPYKKCLMSDHQKSYRGPHAFRTANSGESELGYFGSDLALRKQNSILHSVYWQRIILDEAHYIKDRHSNTAKAVFALDSLYKWALSGTPLQNRIGELYSLVRFLQIVPYSFYLCKECDCRALDHVSTNLCSTCGHSHFRHFCWWNKYISNPIKSHWNHDAGKRAMTLLKHGVLKSLLLRRTKKGRAADLALPPRIVKVRRDTLGIKEEDYYKSLYKEIKAQFNTYIKAGTVMNNYAHIFDLLTRLRQAVDHPYLVVYSVTAAQRNASILDTYDAEPVCGICHDPAEEPVASSCKHVFCKECLLHYSANKWKVSCPNCSKLMTVYFDTKADAAAGASQPRKTTSVKGFRSSSILNRIHLDDFQTSTKIEALREEIRDMVERDGSAKGIVFSQFTSFLDLIHYSLIKSGVNCVQLVGTMTLSQRDAAIKRFNDDPDCKIFLMSLKAGGVALNLTVASNIFMMDPWWNPAVERQAQDRIHRIGQYKPIRIVRFVIENTVEERILQLQQKKELAFEGTVGNSSSSESIGQLTFADLRFLFLN